MGSACFVRGNAQLGQELQTFLKEKGLEDSVHISGTLCQDMCNEGPVLKVDGVCHCRMNMENLTGLLLDSK